MYNLKVTLHDTILARCAVYCDISIVELYELAVIHEREVVAVDRDGGAIRQVDMPIKPFHHYYINIVAVLVKERIKPLCRA
ncbi:unknown [Prevotella sp. CAG:1058]|nr:unknown [Prevotella sp. CAG:1058]